MAPERWRHHLDYLVTLLGGSIGAGSLIKFPYLCMRNGGGVFLIPFLFFTFMGAIPCVFLEMVIGQYSQSGPVNVWNLCPPFKGIGLGIALVNWIYVTYYIAIFAWFMYYFYHSFFVNLPWTSCDQSWNSPGCIADIDNSVRNSTSANATQLIPSAPDEHNLTDITKTVPGMTAAEEFWRFQVLQMTDGLEDLDGIRWPLVGCMAVTCVIMFLFRGIKVSGKMWIEACRSALFSLNIGLGNIITMAGHNKITRNCFRDALLVSMVDILFLVLAGFAFFATI
ncbi:sodium- and chloride-dependent creatine transporter 1-like isoform X2 [Haliotis rufescens]|uniref:sodium- and chloride-dependent creatine transporter 1-like isoform X2 n=2 Tax=Haliotis rufescens TaxID=6454 RepID=UPI00201EE797|nr:sodium- and chloride-dependent creatine transporter 1-like isoform X2 [Haliotis rufescens]